MIAFSCPHCGLKLKVKDEFAGRPAPCPTCKHQLVVPQPDRTQAVPADRIDGLLSSMARAGVEAGVTLDGGAVPAGKLPGEKRSLRDLLERHGKGGERYLLAGEIARGGMGVVLRAVDCDIRREVAVKFLLDQSDLRRKARFVEEAQITGQLEHPNIVPIHELGIDAQKRLFFSMKIVKGRSLGDVLDAHRQNPRTAEREFSLGRLLSILVNVCHALAYAHSRGVIHRDLKPANIMVGDFGEVYVMDWGLAKVLGSNPEAHGVQSVGLPATSSKVVVTRDGDADLTQDGAVMGTPAYMPPEQALGQVAALDGRSDVYSLGAILYEMLTLQPPVDKEGGYIGTLMRVSQGEIAQPEIRAPERAKKGKIPKELAAIAMKAMARDPAGRYPKVEAFRQDIERYLEGRSVSAKQDTTREMIWKLVRRNKAVSAASAVFLCLLMLAFGFTLQNYLAYRTEQKDKERRMKQAVPAFVRAAQLALSKGELDDAMTQATAALEYDPDYADAHFLKGQLLIVRQDYPAARAELEWYLKQKPQDKAAARLTELCRKARANDDFTLLNFAEEFTEQGLLPLADAVAGENAGRLRGKMLEIYRKRIEQAWPGLGSCLADAPTGFCLDLGAGSAWLRSWKRKPITDLSPLRGMALTELTLLSCDQVRDLSPLAGTRLRRLDLMGCGRVRDLSPLKGMPLVWMRLVYNHQVKDLSPLRGMPLKELQLGECGQISDLTPLQGLKLTYLDLSKCGQIADLTPLQGMPLTRLGLYRCDSVRDLAPLKGMSLNHLDLFGCGAAKDLSLLRGMPLSSLHVGGIDRRGNLTSLQALPLRQLGLADSMIDDLAPLKGLKLNLLSLGRCPVTDLSPLRGMPLTHLELQDCAKIRDIAPLQGMKLTRLRLDGTQVRDLSPLEGADLREVHLPERVDKGTNVLRRMRDLVNINGQPAKDWWKDHYDANRYKP